MQGTDFPPACFSKKTALNATRNLEKIIIASKLKEKWLGHHICFRSVIRKGLFMTRALEGIKVVEMALQYPGPYCSTLLSGLGAEVIKVEKPGTGDAARRRPAFFNCINHDKKSVTLDLKHPAGKEILYRLVGACDVVTEGFRPGVAARLAIDYPRLSTVNPRLVYCSISGYGQSGPYSDLPGHDLNYMSLSGMLHYFQDAQGHPIMPGVAIADLSAGMFAALGITAALAARARTGRGQQVDVAMLDGLLSWMGTNLSLYAETGRTEKNRDAGYGLFSTGDGKRLALGIAHEDWFWDRLCRAVGLEELAGIPGLERNRRRAELVVPLQDALMRKPLAAWLKVFKDADVPATPVLEPGEVLEDAHARARGMLEVVTDRQGNRSVRTGFPVKFAPGAPPARKTDPPLLGEHTEEILKSLGYHEKDIQDFKSENII
jgi:crotonobetainyl-CoA:carnitine CoA-transferase CaiB-like acyl-CoA transferase